MIEKKVSKLLSRLQEVEDLLSQSDVYSDQKRYRELTQEHAYLLDVKRVAEELKKVIASCQENEALLKEGVEDPDLAQMLEEDTVLLKEKEQQLSTKLEELLVPPDPHDNNNAILEVRAGTGGDEAALFVGDCIRMYRLYADLKGWTCELLSCAPAEVGGFKEYIMVLSGPQVYRLMRHEGGTHRVQRVPETEAQGRVHTSAITVAVLLEPGEDEEVKIDESELRIDTMRASGAGGQHVNVTDSAVRLTHLPTGIVVCCQDERSQHKNKAKAMRLLAAKIAEKEREKKQQELALSRQSQVGSGDRSERIRTYNFSQNRVTDHRINLTLYNLNQVLNGDLDTVTSALVAYFHQKQLA